MCNKLLALLPFLKEKILTAIDSTSFQLVCEVINSPNNVPEVA